jgi:hypothetical protein
MLIRSHRFQFDVPDGWRAEQENGRLALHGPEDEELIVSGTVITKIEQGTDLAALTSELLENAKKAMRAATDHPDLQVIWPARRDPSIGQVECWTSHAETRDKGVMFSQAAVIGSGSMLLITFEAPNDLPHHEVLMKLLKSVRPLVAN